MMVLAFLALLMFCGVVGVVCWLALSRILDHMRRNPEAAKLISEHIITPILMGKEPQPEETPDIGADGHP
jgi:uncharacterized membrane protein